jgi:tRNA dimethylallyltransferase
MTSEHLAVLGPTCSWKSAVAILAAEHLHGEILNCDSMQVYRGMDIGTAKPGLEERSRVRHHLVDCLAMEAPCDAAIYAAMAEPILTDLERRGARAVLVGGTGMYARTLIYGLELLPADRTLSADLMRILATPGGRETLIRELETRSGDLPLPREVLENPRRLLRAVEVTRLTGFTPWQWRRQPSPPPRHPFRQYILMPDLKILQERIAIRTTAMLRAGWIDEARVLLAQGLLTTPTARQALGYRDIAAFLGSSATSLTDLHQRLTQLTVKYARRQRTWFRHQHPGAVVVAIHRDTTPEEIANLILHHHQDCQNLPTGQNHVLQLSIS